MTAVGRPLRRVEDARLLRGGGRFVDDVDRPGQLWMRVVRSTVAHARLLGHRHGGGARRCPAWSPS